jgi:hypothetical protein
MEKRVFCQLNGNRKVIGILRGYDVRSIRISYPVLGSQELVWRISSVAWANSVLMRRLTMRMRDLGKRRANRIFTGLHEHCP